MDQGRATRRYYSVFAPVMIMFLAGSFGIAWLEDNTATPNWMLAGLAMIPIAALLSMFWLHWRYVRDVDEYLRQIHVKALLFSAAVALGIGTGWGYLEFYLEAPALPVFWLNPLFWTVYGIAVMAFSLRDGVSQS